MGWWEQWVAAQATTPSPDWILERYGAHWLRLVEPRVKASTLKRYRDVLTWYVMPSFGVIAISDIRRPALKSWIMGLRREKSLHTCSSAVRCLSAVLQSAVEDELIPSNPCARLLRAVGLTDPGEVDVTLTEEELATLLRAVAVHESPFQLPLLMLAHLPLRLGEAMGLFWQHYDPDNRRLKILQQMTQDGEFTSPKTRSSVRELGVPGDLAGVLEGELRRRREQAFRLRVEVEPLILWPELWHDRTKYRVEQKRRKLRFALRRALKAAELDIKMTPHDFRHVWATNMLRLGKPIAWVSYCMGHASVSITDKTYGRHLPRRNPEAVEDYAERLRAHGAQKVIGFTKPR